MAKGLRLGKMVTALKASMLRVNARAMASIPFMTEKSMKANPVAHTYTVTARVGEDSTRQLMPGMVAKCQLHSVEDKASQSGEMVIPARCVLLTKHGATVWVAENGVAQRRTIVIDRYQAEGIAVTDGLRVGDTLIIDGYQKLYNGCAVSLQ